MFLDRGTYQFFEDVTRLILGLSDNIMHRFCYEYPIALRKVKAIGLNVYFLHIFNSFYSQTNSGGGAVYALRF